MPTPEQIGNLEKLADYLESLPPDYDHFNMGWFYAHQNHETDRFDEADIHLPVDINPEKLEHRCGSVACVIGHGPSAGIMPRPGEYWMSYAWRVFGVLDDTDVDMDLFPEGWIEDTSWWDYLFSEEWKHYDNSIAGAVKRIHIFLKETGNEITP